MSTPPIGSGNTTGNKAETKKSSGLGNYDVDASDFLNMMLTQLQNQDPENPTDSSQLLTQMSQIGQLQASTSLQSTLKTLQLQSTLGSASNMIGKSIQGLNDDGDDVSGIVDSVKVKGGNVYCELTTGDSVAMSNVTSVNATTSSGAGTAVAKT